MYADTVFDEEPRWSRRPGRRLALNFFPASLIVAGALMLLRLPVLEQTQPLAELFVRILVSDIEKVLESPFVEEIPVEPIQPTATTQVLPPTAPITTVSRKPTDWYVQIPDAAKKLLDSFPRAYSVNPNFDDRRRIAAEQFRPSRAPADRPIWENVEKDTMGRTLLVSGDCYKVIDDPNVGNRDAFLVFGQYITSCAYYKRPPQELGFVREIRDRRAGQVRYGRRAAE
jgi:hypothetical protein